MIEVETAALHEAESRLQGAIRTHDVEALDALLHQEVRFVGPDGLAVDKATDLAAHRSGFLSFDEVTELQRDLQVFGDVGVTRVTLRLVGEAGGQPLDAELAYTRTWQRRADSWIVVAAHGSVVPRPA